MPEEKDSFVRLTFEGGRFIGHEAPVDSLAELSTFQDIVVGIARELFYERHPERARLPKGFVEAGELRIISAEQNCWSGSLARRREAPIEQASLFVEAKDLALKALRAAELGSEAPPELPRNMFRQLSALGRSLEPSEFLLVGTDAAFSAARVDRGSRQRVAKWAHSPLIEDVVEGEVVRLDDAGHKFVLRTNEGNQVEVPFDLEQRERLLKALDQRPAALVRVGGTLQVGRVSKALLVDNLTTVDHARADDIQRVWERIDSFEQIQDGWFGEGSTAPTRTARSFARAVLSRVLATDENRERPKVYPTPDGGVQAEWLIGLWAVDVHFDPEEEVARAEATHSDTGEEREAGFPGLSSEDAGLLVAWISEIQ